MYENSLDLINGSCVCVMAVLPTIPTALSAEYPACDSSHWAF